MYKQVIIVSATKMSEKEFWQKAPLAQYLKRQIDSSWHVVYNNTDGLSSVYNRWLIHDRFRDFIILFVHDDVNIQDTFLEEKLNEAIEQYDVVGLAGGKEITLSSPALWHLMSKQLFGSVAHLFPDHLIRMSSFGPTPARCLLIDGLFIAVNTEKILDSGVKFDENFNFHFYDLDFSLAANRAKLKIGTWPIWVIHSGLGDSFRSKEWKECETKFLSKWRA